MALEASALHPDIAEAALVFGELEATSGDAPPQVALHVAGDKISGVFPIMEATTYRFMLEEFRVSLFAQRLGTRIPVSKKRLEAAWGKAVA